MHSSLTVRSRVKILKVEKISKKMKVMSNKLLAKVLKDKNLEIATEIKEKLEPNTEYEITFSEEKIILIKINPSVKKNIIYS